MSAPPVNHDDAVDKLLRRALSHVSYPTPVQQQDARGTILSQAARQTPLPVPAASRWFTLWARRTAVFSLLRHALTDDSAFHRAEHGDFGRMVSLQYAPSVAFQPMW